MPSEQLDASEPTRTVIEGLETIEHVEGDPMGGETLWFADADHGAESRQRKQEMATVLSRAHFHGLVVADVDFHDQTITLRDTHDTHWYFDVKDEDRERYATVGDDA